MQIAFKEWAVVVEALGRGEQIIILRKGGLHEGSDGFQVNHQRFFLFPTMFHQQRDLVIPSASSRFEARTPLTPNESHVSLEFYAEVACTQRLYSRADADRLRGQHIWRDEVIAKRFDWGQEAGIHAMVVRVNRLPAAIELPMLPAYRGCKSWVTLDRDLPTSGGEPVLSDAKFAGKLEAFRSALAPAPATP